MKTVIDLAQWLPLSGALKVIARTHRVLYQAVDAGVVHTQELGNGFRLYNRADLEEMARAGRDWRQLVGGGAT